MSAHGTIYRFNALDENYPVEVAHIRKARARIEAETEAQLEEQARIRADAMARSVAPNELLQSRELDLHRLEREHLRAENLAIAAVEHRMEAELRAIEADNACIHMEERARQAAEERAQMADQTLQAARARVEDETQMLLQMQKCREAEMCAHEAMAQRRAGQEDLIQALRHQEALERAMSVSQRAALKGVKETVMALELQQALWRMRRQRRLLLLLLLAMAAGLVALGVDLEVTRTWTTKL